MGEQQVQQQTERGRDLRGSRRTGLREFGFFVGGKAQPKERPRFNRKTGYVYTPDKTKKAEARLAEQWADQGGPCFPADVPLEVELRFTADGTYVIVRPLDPQKIVIRGDLDNLLKLVLDGLNEVAWSDDRQVISIKAVKE